MAIYGLSGTNAAGKDSVGEMLAERHNFLFIPATDMLREAAREKGLEPNRENLAGISTAWRREHGMGAVVDVAIERNKDQMSKYAGLVIASLRHPGEADRIHELGGKVIWIDADPEVRYKRVAANAHSRGRGAEDNKTYEEFLAEQEREMQHTGDEATLNIGAVRDRADIFIENNGNDIEAFKDAAEKALGLR